MMPPELEKIAESEARKYCDGLGYVSWHDTMDTYLAAFTKAYEILSERDEFQLKQIIQLLDEKKRLRDALKTLLDQPFSGSWDAQASYIQEILGKEKCICGEINARHCPVHNEGK